MGRWSRLAATTGAVGAAGLTGGTGIFANRVIDKTQKSK
jgi:hypothetical protein